MTVTTRALDVGMLLLGAVGLFAGLARLGTSPLVGVLIILSAMFFLLFPVTKDLYIVQIIYVPAQDSKQKAFHHFIDIDLHCLLHILFFL